MRAWSVSSELPLPYVCVVRRLQRGIPGSPVSDLPLRKVSAKAQVYARLSGESRSAAGPQADSSGEAPRCVRRTVDGRSWTLPVGAPSMAAAAGDVRANENVVLTAIHTRRAVSHSREVR